MRIYGNLMNRVAESAKPPEPVIGMGATLCYYSDRHAATVIEVGQKNRVKYVVVRQDTARRTDTNGQSESQTYQYEPNPDGAEYKFTLRKNGRYVQAGSSMKNGTGLLLGVREEYYDFGF